MSSVVLLSSVKLFNRCPLTPMVLHCGRRISISKDFKHFSVAHLDSFRREDKFKKIPLCTLTPLGNPKYREYTDVSKNTEKHNTGATKENDEEQIVKKENVENFLHLEKSASNTSMEAASPIPKVDEAVQNLSAAAGDKNCGQEQGQKQTQEQQSQQQDNLHKYYLEFEKLLYLSIAGVIDAFYAILASNELKLVKLTAIRTFNWMNSIVKKHIIENPKVQRKVEEIKANVEKARREDVSSRS